MCPISFLFSFFFVISAFISFRNSKKNNILITKNPNQKSVEKLCVNSTDRKQTEKALTWSESSVCCYVWCAWHSRPLWRIFGHKMTLNDCLPIHWISWSCGLCAVCELCLYTFFFSFLFLSFFIYGRCVRVAACVRACVCIFDLTYFSKRTRYWILNHTQIFWSNPIYQMRTNFWFRISRIPSPITSIESVEHTYACSKYTRSLISFHGFHIFA